MGFKNAASILFFSLVFGQISHEPLLAQAESSPTSWTSADGKTIEAEFVRLTDDGVVLRSKGREIEVPFAKLDLDSHLQAIKLGKPEAFAKPLPKAKEEIKPVEPSNVVEVDETLESPFTGDETIDEFIGTFTSEVTNGNYFVVWHCLPKKMQNDIQDLAVKAFTQIGPAPIVQMRVIMRDLSTIVNEKEEFIFGYPEIKGNPLLEAQLKQQWALNREILNGLADEELWQKENFEKENIVQWMAKISAVYGQHHDSLDESAGGQLNNFINSLFKVTQQTADSAELEITIPGQPPQTVKATRSKISKIWIIGSWMSNLRKGIDTANDQVELIPTPVIQTGFALAAPLLTALKNAETQEEFNAALDSIEKLVEGFASQGSDSGPGDSSASGPGSSRGGSGPRIGRPGA